MFAPQQFRPARAAAHHARACTLRGVDQAELDTDQCKRLRDATGRRLGWLRRVLHRMDHRQWAKSDPLYEQVQRTSDEMMRLDMLLMQISLLARHPRARIIAPAYKPEDRPPKAE